MAGTIRIKNTTFGEGRTKVCIPIVAKTREEALIEAKRIVDASAKTTIDVVEFRGDFFEELGDFESLKDLLAELGSVLKDLVVLFTIRSESEGGEHLSFMTPAISEINEFVITNKLADMVDVELFADYDVKKLVELAKSKGVKIIMSNHDFHKTPEVEEITDRLKKMQDIGADIAKIAVMPQSKKDVLDLLDATQIMKSDSPKTPVVTMSMGKLGAISRVAGNVFGSAMTFATIEKASAPGQMSVETVNYILDML